MNDIKLSGLKPIREARKITKEKLCNDINLRNDSGVDFVLTPEYITKLESRKQSKIEDNLLQALMDYLHVTLDELTGKKPFTEYECTVGTRKICINTTIVSDEVTRTRFSYETEINEKISDHCVDFTLSYVFRRFGVISTKEEFVALVRVVTHIFASYSNFIQLNNRVLEEEEEQEFIINELNELEYRDVLTWARIMSLVFQCFQDTLKLTVKDTQVLTTTFMDLVLKYNLW